MQAQYKIEYFSGLTTIFVHILDHRGAKLCPPLTFESIVAAREYCRDGYESRGQSWHGTSQRACGAYTETGQLVDLERSNSNENVHNQD